MVINRIFICHAIRCTEQQNIQILRYVLEVLQRTGIEIVVNNNNGSVESYLLQLRQELPTCQALILMQTPDAIYAPRVQLAIREAKKLIEQKRMQAIFRFICSPSARATIPQDWKGMTTFDGTSNYQQACTKLALKLLEDSLGNSRAEQTAQRDAPSPLPKVRLPQRPLQTSSANPIDGNRSPGEVTTGALLPFPGLRLPQRSPQTSSANPINGNRPPGQVITGALSPLPNISLPDMPPQTKLDQSWTAHLKPIPEKSPDKAHNTRGRRKILMGLVIVLIIISVAGLAEAFALLRPINLVGSKPVSPSPSSSVGQVNFFGSDQIGTDNNTGIADEVQIRLKNLTAPTAGHSYYAWLLPSQGASETDTTISLGRLTVNNGAANLTYANPTHENLLLTESSFLISEENSSLTPNLPSPDQHAWRYYAAIPQTPNPHDPNHYNYLDHIQHLLAKDPTLQELGMQGGLSIWFYKNVKKIREWADATQGTGVQQNLADVHRDLVRILDYLDGANNVTGDVPLGTPILVDPPQLVRIPLLTFDPVHQEPLGYVYHIQTHLQGLTKSPGVTDGQRKIAGQINDELEKVNVALEQVRQDAMKLVNMPVAQLASPEAMPTFTDLVNKADIAFGGQSDPATNTRQGGAVWIHNAVLQLTALDVKPFTSLS